MRPRAWWGRVPDEGDMGKPGEGHLLGKEPASGGSQGTEPVLEAWRRVRPSR